MAKISREKWKVYGNVFDEFALRNLFKLASQGHFEELQSPISIGKEANVFTALKKDGERVIVKIYRLETADFNKMYSYLNSDPRFQHIKKQRRRIIFAWCQREYRNLMIARENGVPVPTPYAFKDNILVMELIGNRHEVAPKLKDAVPEDLGKFFKSVVRNMRKLYKAGFVHTDLSSFNILNWKEKPVFIDMSQSTPLEDSGAEEYLKRDVRNICNFFKRHGLECSESETRQEIMKNGMVG